MILYRLLLITFALLLSFSANAALSSQCQPLIEHNRPAQKLKYDKGLLWQVNKAGQATSYVFGTIHVSDPSIVALPEPVSQALNSSEQFVMEALPDTEQIMLMTRMMFFQEGQQLSEYIDEAIYQRATEILSRYSMMPEVVSVMKPWAAFLMMNYPPETGDALDLVLFSIAQQNGATVNGLETLEEQGQLFNQLSLTDQARLLIDTVCHYDVVENDFAVMKSLYLERNLAGLFEHANRYDMIDEPLYKDLMQKLINDRNHKMVERMQPILAKGKSFIAIGAMHLSGEEGVLELLERQGYQVSVVY